MQYVYGIHAVDSLLRQNPKSVQHLLLQAGREDKRIAPCWNWPAIRGCRCCGSLARPRQAGQWPSPGRGGLIAGCPVQGGVCSSPICGVSATCWRGGEQGSPLLILVLDGVTDPHNLGACLRSADAAGVDAVVVPKDKSADLTPVARKVACGAAEVVPFVRVTNISRTLQALQERGVWLYGTDGEAGNPCMTVT